MELLNKLYYTVRKKEVEIAKRRLRKINIDVILKCISKSCWKYNVQYEVILKTAEILVIKIKGKKSNLILKYHICDLVFMEGYNSFMDYLFIYNRCMGIYITTGVFESKAIRASNSIFLHNKIRLENNITFIRKQLGLFGKANQIFKYRKLRFDRYLPN